MANWVLERARCTDEYSVEQLARILKTDIQHFNHLAEDKRGNRLFLIQPPSGTPPYRVYRARMVYGPSPGQSTLQIVPGSENDHLELYVAGVGIGACRNNHWNIEIRPVWNPDTLSCDYFVDNGQKPLSLEQISQRILGDFLFENWTP